MARESDTEAAEVAHDAFLLICCACVFFTWEELVAAPASAISATSRSTSRTFQRTGVSGGSAAFFSAARASKSTVVACDSGASSLLPPAASGD
jgi:hypothetical protein